MRVLVLDHATRPTDVLAEGLRDEGMAVDVAHNETDVTAKLAVNADQVVVLERGFPDLCRGDALCGRITGDGTGRWC